MTSGKWHSPPAELREAWVRAFSGEGGTDVPSPCPVCGAQALHRYYDLDRRYGEDEGRSGFVGRGSLWEWCRTCQAYEHYSAMVPAWWSVDRLLPSSELFHSPGPIDDVLARRIDPPANPPLQPTPQSRRG